MLRRMREGDRYLIERYEGEPLEAQVQRYILDPDFEDSALYAAGAFVYARSFVSQPENAMKEWFHQTVTGSVQDQLSLPWVLSRYRARIKTIPEPLFDNHFIEYLYSH